MPASVLEKQSDPATAESAHSSADESVADERPPKLIDESVFDRKERTVDPNGCANCRRVYKVFGFY